MGLKDYYECRLRGPLEAANLHRHIERVYHAAKKASTITQVMVPRTRTIEVSGIEAQFRVTNKGVDKDFPSFFKEDGEGIPISMMTAEAGNNDIFWDIGANVGQYSCIVGQTTRSVVCFEPNCRTASQLKQNLEINGVNAQVVEAAVGRDPGFIEFGSSSSLAGSLGRVKGESGSTPMVTGDGLVESGDLEPPDLVKIDVTGKELETIAGMAEALSWVRLAIVEVHPGLIEDGFTRTRSALENLGFDVKTIRIQKSSNVNMIMGKRQ